MLTRGVQGLVAGKYRKKGGTNRAVLNFLGLDDIGGGQSAFDSGQDS